MSRDFEPYEGHHHHEENDSCCCRDCLVNCSKKICKHVFDTIMILFIYSTINKIYS